MTGAEIEPSDEISKQATWITGQLSATLIIPISFARSSSGMDSATTVVVKRHSNGFCVKKSLLIAIASKISYKAKKLQKWPRT